MKNIQIIIAVFILGISILNIDTLDVFAEEITEDITSIQNTEESTTLVDTTIVAETFVVTFKDRHGNKMKEVIVKKGDIVEEYIPDLPENKVYFGWIIDDENTEFDFNTPINRDIKLILSCKSKPYEEMYTYQINFDSNYDEKIETTYEDTAAIKTAINEPKTPTRNNYKFLGWYTEKDGGKKWNFQKDETDGPMTLYAHWQYIGNLNLTSPKTGYNIQITVVVLILSLSSLGFAVAKIKEQ